MVQCPEKSDLAEGIETIQNTDSPIRQSTSSSTKDQQSLQGTKDSRRSQDSVETIDPATGGVEDAGKVKSNTSSIPSPLVTVPRSQRRGLFGRFTIIPEVEHPYSYRRSTKWFITAIVALAAIAGPMASAILMRK